MLVAAPAAAASASWAHQAGTLSSNGSVTVKSLAGGSYSATQNPTGAVAKASQNAATQPPTVIVQATASLPIKNVGDACASSTSGASPNQTADEGTAITSDRTSLLTCQSGSWKKASNTKAGDFVGRKARFCGNNGTQIYIYEMVSSTRLDWSRGSSCLSSEGTYLGSYLLSSNGLAYYFGGASSLAVPTHAGIVLHDSTTGSFAAFAPWD